MRSYFEIKIRDKLKSQQHLKQTNRSMYLNPPKMTYRLETFFFHVCILLKACLLSIHYFGFAFRHFLSRLVFSGDLSVLRISLTVFLAEYNRKFAIFIACSSGKVHWDSSAFNEEVFTLPQNFQFNQTFIIRAKQSWNNDNNQF